MAQSNQNILFASDLSVEMKTVFEQAAATALQQNANIVVLHVMEEDPRSEKKIRMAFGEQLYQDLKTQQKQGARNILLGKNVNALKIKQAISGFLDGGDSREESDGSLIKKILVTEGRSIADEIASTALDEECGMIILGCKQRGLLAEAMGDHVVRKVLKRSPVPVLIVPFTED